MESGNYVDIVEGDIFRLTTIKKNDSRKGDCEQKKEGMNSCHICNFSKRLSSDF